MKKRVTVPAVDISHKEQPPPPPHFASVSSPKSRGASTCSHDPSFERGPRGGGGGAGLEGDEDGGRGQALLRPLSGGGGGGGGAAALVHTPVDAS